MVLQNTSMISHTTLKLLVFENNFYINMWRSGPSTLMFLLTRKYSVISAQYVDFFQCKACLILNKRFSKEICDELAVSTMIFSYFCSTNWWHFTTDPFKTSLSNPSLSSPDQFAYYTGDQKSCVPEVQKDRQTESLRLLCYFLSPCLIWATGVS